MIEYLRSKSAAYHLISSFIMVLVIGLSDYLTGLEFGLSIFYILPIYAVTEFVNISGGIFISLISALMWLAADLAKQKDYLHIITPYWNASGRLVFFLVIVFLHNALKFEKLRSRIDPLTGIGNRRYFSETAEIEIKRVNRYESPFSVAYIDIDDFKSINDHFGHEAGDRLLITVAETIRKNTRDTDSVARIGGDEFVLLMPETPDEAAMTTVFKVTESLAASVNRTKWPVTFSTGIVTFRHPPVSVDSMMTIADNVMYSAKQAGKNTIRQEIV